MASPIKNSLRSFFNRWFGKSLCKKKRITPPSAIVLAANLAAMPMCAEMSSAKMIDRNGSLKDSHSPTQESVNNAWHVNRKYATATMRNPNLSGEKKFGFDIVLNNKWELIAFIRLVE
jgi:hypothetical protein